MFGLERQLDKDIKVILGLNGFHVGMLDEAETKAFNRLVSRGLARRVYEGSGGFMGMAKVSVDADL
jgi:hypothetical protein